MKIQLTRTKIWLALIALVLLAGVTAQLPLTFAKDPTSDQIENGMLATVKVYILGADGKAIGTCSGTVVDPAGYILTNFHCVGAVADVPNSMNLKPGELYNSKGLVVIAPTLDSKKAPKPTYIAQFLTGNYILDVAVLKIVAMYNQGEQLPTTLPLVVIERSDSDKVKVGDFVASVGYPGIGGALISYMPGQISGFDDRNNDGILDSFKTSANIAGGNSGGLGMNDNGEQIGISTWGLSSGASKIDRFMVINIAEPYIQKALTMGSAQTADPTPVAGPTPVAPPSTSQPAFGKIQFGTQVTNGQLADAGTQFPAGISTVYGLYEVSGMRAAGMDWGAVWSIDGSVVAGATTGKSWNGPTSGSYANSLTAATGKTLPDGKYKLTLYINGSIASAGEFTVGKTGTPPPQPPSQTDTGVVLKGQIVDADTQRGIPKSVIVILEPGVTLEEWDAALTAGTEDDLIAAFGVGDDEGSYQTAPGLPRAQAYVTIVGAQGHQRRALKLELLANDPSVLKMAPVALQKR